MWRKQDKQIQYLFNKHAIFMTHHKLQDKDNKTMIQALRTNLVQDATHEPDIQDPADEDAHTLPHAGTHITISGNTKTGNVDHPSHSWSFLTSNIDRTKSYISNIWIIPRPRLPLGQNYIHTTLTEYTKKLILTDSAGNTGPTAFLLMLFTSIKGTGTTKTIDFSNYTNGEQAWMFQCLFHCLTDIGAGFELEENDIFDGTPKGDSLIVSPAELYYSKDNAKTQTGTNKLLYTRVPQVNVYGYSNNVLDSLTLADYNVKSNSKLKVIDTAAPTEQFIMDESTDQKFKHWWDVILGANSNITGVPQKSDSIYELFFGSFDHYNLIGDLLTDSHIAANYQTDDPYIFDMYLNRTTGSLETHWNMSKTFIIPHTAWLPVMETIHKLPKLFNELGNVILPTVVISLARQKSTELSEYKEVSSYIRHLVAYEYNLSYDAYGNPTYTDKGSFILKRGNVGEASPSGLIYQQQYFF